MSDEKIKTKKKDKSVWKTLGSAALAVGGVAVMVAKALSGNNKA